MAFIQLEELRKIREQNRDKRIIFCSGVFDLTHAGHVLFFEDCKKQGDILVAAVGEDASIRELKGAPRPVLNEHLRIKMVDSLKPVDYCILGITPRGRPLAFIESILENLRPDAYVVNDDAFDMPARQKMAEKYGVPLVILQRQCPEEFDGVSTTKIIDKIKKLS